jgi:hypothetical protein
MIRRLRLGNLRKLLRDRCGYQLPDDDAGREYLYELLLPISVSPHADIKMPNAIEIWAPWMKTEEAGQLVDQINRTPIRQRKPNAKELGKRLRVINGERERLKLWTIAPFNMNKWEMLAHRRAKARERMRRLRQLRGSRSRAAWLANSLTRKKPWEKEGISRRTWERRRRDAGPCAVRLLNAENTPASEQTSRPKERAIPLHRGRASKRTKAEKPESGEENMASAMTDRELGERTCVTPDRELGGHTCATADGWWRNSRTPDERLEWQALTSKSSVH